MSCGDQDMTMQTAAGETVKPQLAQMRKISAISAAISLRGFRQRLILLKNRRFRRRPPAARPAPVNGWFTKPEEDDAPRAARGRVARN
jgi:hypothetical protein